MNDNITISSIEDEDNAGVFETVIELKVFVDDTNDEFIFDVNQETDYGTNIVVLDPEDATVALPSEVSVVLRFNNITNDSIDIEFISGGYLTLFKNLDELMYSDITVNETAPQWNQISLFTSGYGTPTVTNTSAAEFFSLY